MARNILFKIVAEVLAKAWDPIGLANEPGTEDEYEIFVAPVVKLLLAGSTPQAVADALLDLERRELGLPGDPERAARAAERSIEAFGKWRSAFAPPAVTDLPDRAVRFRFTPNALRFFRCLRRMNNATGGDGEILVLWIRTDPKRDGQKIMLNFAWFPADAITRRRGHIVRRQGIRVALDVSADLASVLDGALCDVEGPYGPAFLVRPEI